MTLNTIELNDNDFELDFLSDENEFKHKNKRFHTPYQILIADDDEDMHRATKLLLKNFKFEERTLEFIDTYTGDETIRVLNEREDIAVVLLDVVMESKVAGLEVVDYIRKIKQNHSIRIILRTGQPGEAPEEKVIEEYDINDYRLKSELTAQRLYTSMYEALRSYRDIMVLEHSKASLARMIKMSSNLFSQESIEDIYTCILDQLLCSKDIQPSAVYFREKCQDCGLVFLERETYGTIIAATGRYRNFLGKNIKEVPELEEIQTKAENLMSNNQDAFSHMDKGYLISKTSNVGLKSFIYIESIEFDFDINLIEDYLSNYSKALDNYLMNQELIDTQKELISLLVDTIDTRCSEIGQHVVRVGKIGELIASEIGLNMDVKKIINISSRLHDVGGSSLFLNPVQHYSEKSVDSDEMYIIKKAAIIAGTINKEREKEGYPLGITKDMLITIAEIMFLADFYDSNKAKEANYELTEEKYRSSSNGLFNSYIWNTFIKLKSQIDQMIGKYPD